MIHVCFGLYDKTGRYSKFTGTAMLSIFENINPALRLPSVTVHILHDNTLTLDNREKFSYLAGQYNQLVKFYNVEELCAEKIAEVKKFVSIIFKTRLSIATFYRFFITNVLPPEINKFIYLDSDIIVNLDIEKLWKVDLGDKLVAAVPEYFNGINSQKMIPMCREGIIKAEDYFNAGVLLLNSKFIKGKEETLQSELKFIGEHPEYGLFDQDILNRIFSTNYVKLPVEFNYFIKSHSHSEEDFSFGKIYHYTDSNSGIGITLDTSNPFSQLWMHHFIKTPWFDEKAIGRLYEGVRQMNVGLKNSMLKVSAMMSGKTRAFFTLQPNVEATKKIFSIRDDEEIILADNPNSLQKLIDAMKLSKGKKVFFILVPGFPFQVLAQAGFVFAEDFLNGMDFLSEAHGIKFNSYPLLNAM